MFWSEFIDKNIKWISNCNFSLRFILLRQASESRIRDADMAKEMLEYSNTNILEQVGYAMMAQANKNNQAVLELLS